MKKTLIYPGTFDPFTLGHKDLVARATQLFDRVIIAVSNNRDKNTLFSVDERIEMIKALFSDNPSITVETFSGLLVDFAKSKKAYTILRGLRSMADVDYEMEMANMNRMLLPELETIFLSPAPAYAFISSTLVKVVARSKGELKAFVPGLVIERLKTKF